MEPGDSGRFAVIEGGPRRLWQTVEETYRWWEERGQPEWSSFGVTVTPDRQYAWYGSPDSGTSWRLPAV